VLELPFPDRHFAAVFYHHVIEHVSDGPGSLREIARVMRSGAVLYVGTPNRHRIVGYLGSYDAGVADKLRWNLADYRARLAGRFRNELGAHAGYTEAELARHLRAHFRDVRSVTADYLRTKYGGRLPAGVLAALVARPVREFASPSVYAIARR
jgi:ubiquinone/menaquinone biosynthesis C-methylase UbiE